MPTLKVEMSQTSYIMSNLPQSFCSYLFRLGQLPTVLLSFVIGGSGLVLDFSYTMVLWYTMLLLATLCHLGAQNSDFFFKRSTLNV